MTGKRVNPERILTKSEVNRRFWERHPRARRTADVKHLYGLTLEAYEKLVSQPCGLCGSSKYIRPDHDHTCLTCGFKNGTRKMACSNCGSPLRIRGPLCQKHNTALGNLEALMREGLLEKALEWIRRGE
jgi:hypothetical protein